MRRRAEIHAMLLLGLACGPGSANRSLAPPAPIRVAALDDLDRGQLDADQRSGSGAHIADLLNQPLADRVTVVERRGKTLVLEARGGDPETLAAHLVAPGLVSVEVVNGRIEVELESEMFADVRVLGLDTGSHTLAPHGLVLLPRDDDGVTLEFVPAPTERHWRLLNGGHVDVVPFLGPEAAERLRATPSVEVVRLPVTTVIALQLGRALPKAAREAIAATVDAGAVARAVCGSGCRASVPPVLSSPEAGATEDRAVRLSYLRGEAAEATGARAIAHQLLESGIDVEIEPTALDAMAGMLEEGAFDLALTPMPSEPEAFRRWQIHDVIPLWNDQLYTAYDRSICGVQPDSATSWAWLADVYRCEDRPQ